jgi:hypothetical protein
MESMAFFNTTPLVEDAGFAGGAGLARTAGFVATFGGVVVGLPVVAGFVCENPAPTERTIALTIKIVFIYVFFKFSVII